MAIQHVFITDVRCFRGEHRIPLRPLTLLVGENSAGKSTFLAALRLASRVASGEFAPDFNEEPFTLGAYDQLASYHGGRAKRAQSFSLGLSRPATGSRPGAPAVEWTDEVSATFTEHLAQPYLSGWCARSAQGAVEATREAGKPLTIEFRLASLARTFEIPADRAGSVAHVTQLWHLLVDQLLHRPAEPNQPVSRGADSESLLHQVALMWRSGVWDEPLPRAIAPIRSKPRRTYDPTRDAPDPEGQHVPMVLASLASSDPTAWAALQVRLAELGQTSGLFEAIEVRRKGDKPSDPFQIEVALGRRAFNITDVGYGVSQVLPILVDTLRSPEGSTFLLQQPEVHLHPRAQAALGSFLGALCRDRHHRFVVETHSDYLVDRIRTDVRDGVSVSPAEVGILFFERSGPWVTVHEIEIDPAGNLTGYPDSFRSFFLEEQRRLLGV